MHQPGEKLNEDHVLIPISQKKLNEYKRLSKKKLDMYNFYYDLLYLVYLQEPQLNPYLEKAARILLSPRTVRCRLADMCLSARIQNQMYLKTKVQKITIKLLMFLKITKKPILTLLRRISQWVEQT